MNAIQLTGRMTQDAKVFTTKNGKQVAQFTLAVQRDYKGADGKPETDFINCKAWGGSASFVADYCNKGTLMSVEGTLNIEKFTGRDGMSRTAAVVVARSVHKLEKKSADRAAAPAPAPAAAEEPEDIWEGDAEPVDFDAAELPF